MDTPSSIAKHLTEQPSLQFLLRFNTNLTRLKARLTRFKTPMSSSIRLPTHTKVPLSPLLNTHLPVTFTNQTLGPTNNKHLCIQQICNLVNIYLFFYENSYFEFGIFFEISVFFQIKRFMEISKKQLLIRNEETKIQRKNLQKSKKFLF